MSEKQVFTCGEVAKMCKVAPRTIYKWFDSGRLKGYRIPGSQDRRIPRKHLVEFLTEHAMELPDELNPEVNHSTGPIYGVELLESLPVGGMIQAMPSRSDLQGVKGYRQGQRVVAGFEVLTDHYRKAMAENARLRAAMEEAAELLRRNRSTLNYNLVIRNMDDAERILTTALSEKGEGC